MWNDAKWHEMTWINMFWIIPQFLDYKMRKIVTNLNSKMFGMNKSRKIVTNLTKLEVSTMTPRNDLVVKNGKHCIFSKNGIIFQQTLYTKFFQRFWTRHFLQSSLFHIIFRKFVKSLQFFRMLLLQMIFHSRSTLSWIQSTLVKNFFTNSTKSVFQVIDFEMTFNEFLVNKFNWFWHSFPKGFVKSEISVPNFDYLVWYQRIIFCSTQMVTVALLTINWKVQNDCTNLFHNCVLIGNR